ncbi:ATP-binding cassette bilirubin transporter BPT1 KNAG_0J02730 [Huiozyma naganishii CBS 8797]|uniref:Bile pigment transporter 1 n=1 Tax=Huiozyma naganishii (strain ATCC MYA-139 / BCRC 22969 / CBS 8797 / KCTC 17520 / NBRC 10181 / NCYC 3082 / Yp74L-3) TaxID=1071383 RepID=J7S310_HUIN7|nr:hypothetical protein KNAG_0J02730 [Kazachstania naganishii CBS 8797]CCK72352.1 hypothetical protein KNAG_0J02730 [Kazachstania naganishii CBS 8797]
MNTVAYFGNTTGCPYGFKPYIDNTVNALNPCFLSMVSMGQALFFLAVGAVQLIQLWRSDKAPRNLAAKILVPTVVPKKHLLHLSSISLQFVLLMCQLILVSSVQSTPSVLKYNIISNLTFVLIISLPTQYLQYFKSICSIGNQLFYYLFQIILLGFEVLQKYSHYPDEAYNLTHGTLSSVLEAALLLNAFNIFLYDVYLFEPAEQIKAYYKEKSWFPTVHVFANLTFTWMNELIMETYHNNKLRDPNNLPLPPVDLDIASICKEVEKNWEVQKWENKFSLFTALWRTFALSIVFAFTFETLKDLLTILEPQFLRLFIIRFNPNVVSTYPILHGVFIALALFLTNVISTLLGNQFYITIFQVGLGIRGSLSTMIYRKSLKLSHSAKEEFSTGDILNYISVDVLKIQRFFENSQSIIGAPIQMVIVLISLYLLLGKATVGGLIPMFIMMPINAMLSRKVKGLFKTKMQYNDARIKTTSEMLNSMKSIKLYAWEKPMLKRLSYIRNDLELANLKKIGIATNLIYFAWNCVPLVVTCSTFAIYSLITDNPLTPELVFPSLSLFNILNDAIYTIPATISQIIETNVSIGRVKKFLLGEELDRSFIEEIADKHDESPFAVEILNATFLWKSKASLQAGDGTDEETSIGSTVVALKDIDFFRAKKNVLTCVVGRVGSGKTTLLKSILGQLPCTSGSQKAIPPKLIIRGESVAYCPQEAWIMNDSIKENILFGHRYDETFYNLTVKACELRPDFKILPDGDNTLVGEKGITLSGGQKARLSLARAVYSRSDIYLLDDVLSAVDAGVRKSIIHRVLDSDTGLLKNKAIILTTNDISVLEHSDRIYVLQDGRIIEESTYAEAIEDNDVKPFLYKLLKEFRAKFGSLELQSSTSSEIKSSASFIKGAEFQDIEDAIDPVVVEVDSRRASLVTLRPHPFVQKDKGDSANNSNAEATAVGKVKWSVYITYAKACGITGVVLFFLFLILSRLFDLAETFWLKYWSEYNQKYNKNIDVWKFVGIYALIGIASAAFNNLRTIILLVYCTIRGAKKLHDNMAHAIVYSSMQFFETTPIGRILNRFSADIDTVDSTLQMVFMVFFKSIFSYLITVILITISMPLFLVFCLFLMVIYIYYQKLFIVQSRELKRMTSISYSPIMSLVGESLGGLAVIRAYKHFSMFKYLNNERVQFNINCVFDYRSTNRWLSIRLQTIGALMVLITGMLSLSTISSSKPLTAGMVGLLMSYVLQVTTSLMWIVRSSVMIETGIVSVERIMEYCELPSEAEQIVDDYRPASNWPSKGAIQFKNYSTRYRANLDPVLKNISININPGEKVGIVGRTGAGKSTLTLALFRLLEPIEGTIIIDGMDISKIGISDLRSHLAIIPQDAQAFEGTVRSNLDPFNMFSDKELDTAITLSHLKPHLKKLMEESGSELPLNDYLELGIKESGSSLSVGQRQLLCLARALLNRSKILVLDEATASVDVETDKIIQATIRESFSDRTIITIAHRIDTVLDSDRILVLEQGEVKEFNSPASLLADKSTLFYQLCEKAGLT